MYVLYPGQNFGVIYVIKRPTSNRYVYQIVVLLTFIIVSAYCAHLRLTEARIAVSSGKLDLQHSYYWLQPVYCVIQTGNNILSIGGVAAVFMGACIPCIPSFSAKIILPFLVGLEFVFVASVTTYIYEVATVPIHGEILFTKSIFLHSVSMFSGAYAYLTFWILIGYGVMLTISSRILAILISVGIQFIELHLLLFHAPQILRYLPTALSRELVVTRFPWYAPGSWAHQEHTLTFASSELTVDSMYHVVHSGLLRPTILLVWYLGICYLMPFLRHFKTSRSNAIISAKQTTNATMEADNDSAY